MFIEKIHDFWSSALYHTCRETIICIPPLLFILKASHVVTTLITVNDYLSKLSSKYTRGAESSKIWLWLRRSKRLRSRLGLRPAFGKISKKNMFFQKKICFLKRKQRAFIQEPEPGLNSGACLTRLAPALQPWNIPFIVLTTNLLHTIRITQGAKFISY